MKNYVEFSKEMRQTAAYPAFVEITNSLRQIMKYQLDMEYYMAVMEDKTAAGMMASGVCKEIEMALARCINQLQHLDSETRDYVSAYERYYFGKNKLEDTV